MFEELVSFTYVGSLKNSGNDMSEIKWKIAIDNISYCGLKQVFILTVVSKGFKIKIWKWDIDLKENVLKWSTDSDTNLTVVCRHRWSR